MAARHRTLPRSSRTRRAAHTPLQRDLRAMARVWEMLRTGTIRWIGEIGRQR
jgi:hypothetical protein